MSRTKDTITTRLLILSDTHALPIPPLPPGPFDVLIHCGDLTRTSLLAEYKTTLALLESVPARLKLVIAGNHDFALDPLASRRIMALAILNRIGDGEAVIREYWRFSAVEKMFDAASASGIKLLREGTHGFELSNGAKLTVYASPFTASKSAVWGFQYVRRPLTTSPDGHPNDGHTWAIPEGVDIAITHSPPYGIFDLTYYAKSRGSRGLLSAVEKARPKIHCFGHIHEGWGAKLVTWRDDAAALPRVEGRIPSQTTETAGSESEVVMSLATLRPRNVDGEKVVSDQELKLTACREMGACEIDLGDDTEHRTLFVNASIQGHGDDEDAFHLPWVVNVQLPRA
ncbi:hypothetical protein NLU13_0065 [Sarocladium strictum]|uniref:Calcineurin-like phosphoesterase domain-containing protein n=1 Tax=Sarocladium strictum TaxID=5046 RepID=A0AA39GNP2_SARSR|nr:hypothetical protein NLU13_0065 [Sarocladium strictum]